MIRSLFHFRSLAWVALLTCQFRQNVLSQDVVYVKTVVDILCSERMHGRGYVKNGDSRASRYIRNEYKRIGIHPFTDTYYQPFAIGVNTYPGAMKLMINGIPLVPGREFVINPASPSCKGTFDGVIIPVRKLAEQNTDSLVSFLKGKVLIIDARAWNELSKQEIAKIMNWRKLLLAGKGNGIRAIVEVTHEKLSFGISDYTIAIPYFRLIASVCPDTVDKITINIRNRYRANYLTRNVAGVIRGTECPDSFLVFSSHYDHLGTMGKRIFDPGANDNAYGVGTMLSLASYFRENPARYSVVFLVFSGEELGLLGSGYFANRPLMKLSAIKFLINLDMIGNGSEGITVVNGSVYPNEFNTLLTINEKEKLLPAIKIRGEACNGDHCPFYKQGVPAFSIYSMGESKAYHDLDDRPELISGAGVEELMRLLIEFSNTL
jgi:aminopeptidase YwaD